MRRVGAIIVALVLMSVLAAEPVGATEYKTVTREIDVGFSGEISGDFSLSFGIGSIDAGFNLGAGVDLPITLTLTYPSEIQPGDEARIEIEVAGTSGGRVWVEFGGYLEGSLGGYSLGRFDFSEQDFIGIVDFAHLVTFDVLVGPDSTGTGSTTKIPVKTWDYGVGSTTVGFSFEIGMEVSSRVVGDVTMDGSAIDGSISDTPTWESGPSYIRQVPVSETAGEGSSFTVRASSMEYILDDIRLWLKTLTFYIDSDNSWPLPDWSGSLSVDVERWFNTGTRGPDTNEVIDGSYQEGIQSISVVVSVPTGADGMMWTFLIAGIVIAGVAIPASIYLLKRRKPARGEVQEVSHAPQPAVHDPGMDARIEQELEMLKH